MRKPLALALGLASVIGALAACESSGGGGSSGNIAFDSGSFDGSGGSDAGPDAVGENDGGGEAGDAAAPFTTFQIAVSSTSACAVFEDGRMKCWGLPNVKAGETPFGVAAGQMGPALPYVTTPAPVKKLVSDIEGYCAIFADGSLRCWGVTLNGQATPGPTALASVTTNIDLGAGHTAIEVAVNDSHGCVVLDDGKVKCWGQGADGKLGTGTMTDLQTPAVDAIDLGTGRKAKAITVSLFFTCALLDDDRVKCWGGAAQPTGQAGSFLAHGSQQAVGGLPNQMGDNLAYAKLGTDPGTSAPWKVKKVVAGYAQACAVLANDRVKCWGQNDLTGVLGNGNTTVGYGAALVDDAIPFVDIGNDPNSGKPWTVTDLTMGYSHVCVTIPKNGGSVRCWGRQDMFGVLGTGVPNGIVGDSPGQMGDALVDVGLKTGRGATTLSASYVATCARVGASVLNCWGRNQSGALGAGLPSTAPSDNLGDDPSELGANFAETFLR